MGIVALGVGVGGPLGIYGALLHTFNHSIAKALLFFTAGNVRENFGTLRMERIRGMARSLPWTSSALVLGGIAIVGMPPFGLFISEFMILSAAFVSGHYLIGMLILLALSVVFGALLYHFQQMLAGEPQTLAERRPGLLASDFAVMTACVAALLVLGVRVPGPLNHLLHAAAEVLR
jgi:hydrogenase-4 component F